MSGTGGAVSSPVNFATILVPGLMASMLGTVMDPRKMQVMFAVILLPAIMLGSGS